MSSEKEIYLETADSIGARLCRDALWAEHRCNWLGSLVDMYGGGGTRPVHRAFGPDLYMGTSGIALFLAHLYRMNPTPQHRTTSMGAMRQALSRSMI